MARPVRRRSRDHEDDGGTGDVLPDDPAAPSAGGTAAGAWDDTHDEADLDPDDDGQATGTEHLDEGSGWRVGPALQRVVVVTGTLLAAALLTGRADGLLLAAPLLAGTVLALGDGLPEVTRRARAAARQDGPRPWPVATATAPLSAAQGAHLPVRVDVWHAHGAQLAVVQVPDGDDLPHGGSVAVPVVDGTARVRATARLRRWGVATAARPDLLVAGPDGLLLHGPHPGFDRRVAVLPAPERTAPAPLPPRAAGLVGVHRTRRPGDGSDLLDVREFRAGDRMRRIDWRVSARRGSLHVRRTAVDADAEVVLCLDTRYDVGADVASWPSPPGLGAAGSSRVGSSLDVSVRAALTLAETFLRQGDRVSLLDLTRPQLNVPRGTGVRHLRRIRRQLAEVGVHLQARRLVLRHGTVPPAAVAVLVSPVLDEAAADLAVSLRRRCRDVVLLDVLPGGLQPPTRSGAERTAFRLMMAERQERLRALAEHGVLVTDWDPLLVPVLLQRAVRQRGRAA
ncbi:DUF58 domain-containing protein [Thalassiella azotivora]